MDTQDLNHLLRDQAGFLGTFPRDQLPKTIQRRPSGIIINTDASNAPGSHWVAIYHSRDGCAEYFDSFGLPPLHKEIITFLNDNNYGWIHNPVTLQDVTSDTCGIYAALYLQSRLARNTREQFISLFTNDGGVNDLIVPFVYLMSQSPASGT